MRKAITFTLIFIGTISSVFIFNLMMYALVPVYHDAISAAVASSGDDIPVITPDMVRSESEDAAASAMNSAGITKLSLTQTKTLEDSEVALSATVEEGKKPIVIDKVYHEDCGSGKGYWVITYDDGSVGIE